MDARDFAFKIFQNHREEFPYITSNHFKLFAAKLPSLRIQTHRDLKFLRRLLLQNDNTFTDEDKILLDASFPADLGPFASQLCSSLLPTTAKSRRRIDFTTKETAQLPSVAEIDKMEVKSLPVDTEKTKSLPYISSVDTLIDEEEILKIGN
jgi:hypothetical protein